MKRFRQILVVEPVQDRAVALERMLVDLGVQSVIHTQTIGRASEMLTMTELDLALLSVEFDGSEVGLALRQLDDRGIPVILVSGPEGLPEAHKHDLRMSLVIPFTREALEATLARAF